MTKNHCRFANYARCFHFMIEVIPLSRAFPNSGENRISAMFRRDVTDKFLNNNSLANSRSPKESNLPASQKGTDGNSYVSPMMESLAESTDTVANMDISTISNATSIFRKARIRIASGIELVEYLRQRGYNYQRLQRGADYLFRNLDDVVGQHLEYFERRVEGETTLEPDFNAFTIMKEKMGELEQRVRAIEEPGRVRGAIRSVGSFFGVTELKLGRMHLTL